VHYNYGFFSVGLPANDGHFGSLPLLLLLLLPAAARKSIKWKSLKGLYIAKEVTRWPTIVLQFLFEQRVFIAGKSLWQRSKAFHFAH